MFAPPDTLTPVPPIAFAIILIDSPVPNHIGAHPNMYPAATAEAIA